MSDPADLFPGFESHYLATGEGKLFTQIGGAGAPLVLLHGFPQTHVMWHAIAPKLAERFRVIVPDLRGYGWSSVVRSTPDHAAYSKREMGRDILAIMNDLGHTRFALVGHDRGARVGYRLALDHPGRLSHLALLDILPTIVMWERIEAASTPISEHWPFLARPVPEPETAIGADPVGWMESKLAGWSKTKDLSAFDPRALRFYRESFAVPERLHAMCEDYRAGATLDRAQDRASREKGETIDCPVLVLWGDAGIPAEGGTPLEAWRGFAPDAQGLAIDSGHFVAEENPVAVLAALSGFLG